MCQFGKGWKLKLFCLFFLNFSAATQAIIAALSVHKFFAGINKLELFVIANFSKFFLKKLLDATPPTTTNFFFLFGYFFLNICSPNSHFFFIIFKIVYWKLQQISDLNLSDLFFFEFTIFKTLVFNPEKEKLQSLEWIKGWASSIEGLPFFANFSIVVHRENQY